VAGPAAFYFGETILGHGLHGLALGVNLPKGIYFGRSWRLIFAFVSPILPGMTTRNSTARIISVCSWFSEEAAANSQRRRESIVLAFSKDSHNVAPPSGRLSWGRPRPHRRGQDALATAGKMPALQAIVHGNY